MIILKEKATTSWRRRLLVLVIAALIYILVINLPLDFTPEQKNVLAVLLVAAILWFSEILPLFVTSLLIPILLFFGTRIPEQELLNPFFDPIIALFMGSFVMAVALSKHKLDKRLANLIYKWFGASPRKFLFGVMLVTAFVGMWISNTAVVAFLLPTIILFIRHNKLRTRAPRLTKSLVLSLAMAAAIGGMATIVGTAPNALAVSFLADQGIEISFFGWMSFGVPLMLILLPIAWFLLGLVYRPEIKKFKPFKESSQPIQKKQVGVLIIIGLVILLWVTQPLHGISPAFVALGGTVALFASGLLNSSDLSKVPFSALIMFGGGLALGESMFHTGLTEQIAAALNSSLANFSEPTILLALIGFSIVITTFASNTAIAAIILPIVVSIAIANNVDIAGLVIATSLALSVDFISPVGTPPSTLVYETGIARIKDFLRAGTTVTVAAVAVLYVVALYFIR